MTLIDKNLGGSEEDRISALPDHLIHQILSLLELKQVIATSALSTRWRFLWTSVPTLDLGTWAYGTDQNIPTQISLSLMNYASPKIRKFRAHFDFADIKHWHVDSWVRFATKRDVEEFDLSLIDECRWKNHDLEGLKAYKFKLLECLLSCESLKVLKLSYFKVNLQSLRLRLLTELELRYVWLSELDTSGCPLLESLILFECNPDEPLNIYVPNPNMRYLMVNNVYTEGSITLFAPNLQSIHFNGYIREAYNIKNLSSLQLASFEFTKFIEVEDVPNPSVVDLFQGVLRASTLRLNHGFMKILSFLDTGVKLPPCRSTCLELKINMQKLDIMGMAHILRSAHSLETLILDICCSPCLEDRYLDAWESLGHSQSSIRLLKDRYLDAWESLGHSLSSIWSLKNVEIKNFLISESDMLYKEPGPKSSIDTFLVNNWDKGIGIELVKILLKNCVILKTMSISTIDIPSWTLKSKVLLLALKKRLLTFPRASRKAEIYFSSSPK